MQAKPGFTRLTAIALVGSAILLGTLQVDRVLADEDPDIKARIAMMKENGKAMKVLAPMFKGKVAYDAMAVREAAATIKKNGGSELTKLFPEGSLSDKSYALPSIWQDWPQFARLSDDMTLYAAGLMEAANNPRIPDDNVLEGADTLGNQGATLGDADKAPTAPRDPLQLAELSPDISFTALLETCGTCHTEFRKDD